MPALDLALSLWVIRRTAGMLHAFALQPFSQIPRDVTGAIVAEQTWFVDNMSLVAARGLQSQIECVCDVLRPHVRAEFPRYDVAAVIVQDCAEIVPTPAKTRQAMLASQRGQ